MKELISRADALAVAMHSKDPVEGIKNLPAVDAVEVVRCKDCKYQDDNTSCPMLNAVAYTKDDDFCCAGRRGRKIKDMCCGGCGAENGGKYENIPQNMLLKVRFPKDGE